MESIEPKTTITIEKKTKEALLSFKTYKKETYNEILEKLIAIYKAWLNGK